MGMSLEQLEERNEEIKKEYHEGLIDIISHVEESIEVCEKLKYQINKDKLDGLKQDLRNTLEWLNEEKEDNGYVEM